eukprot:7063994-Prorocentrum_lima.AAC.1
MKLGRRVFPRTSLRPLPLLPVPHHSRPPRPNHGLFPHDRIALPTAKTAITTAYLCRDGPGRRSI